MGSTSGSSDRRVLVVDDDEDTREVLAMLLGSEGYEVCSVSSGREAMTLMASMPEPPQLALIDIVMPEMSGLEVIREMRRSPRLAGVPVAVISGVPPPRDESDVPVWLLKPPRVPELLDVVQRLIRG